MYAPDYPKQKLNILRNYVRDYIEKAEALLKKAASILTEADYRAIVSRRSTDGDARYEFFNNLLFDGKLPKNVKVYFINSAVDKRKIKGFDTKARAKNYIDMVKDTEPTLGAWFENSNAIYIFIDRVGTENFAIDTVLVHEMCHVWQDRVYKGIHNTTAHSGAFQVAKYKAKRESNGIYDAGAYIDIDKKNRDYESGRYGSPAVGRTERELEDYYANKINKAIKRIFKLPLTVVDPFNARISYKGEAAFDFRNGKFIPARNTQIEKILSYSYNKDKKLCACLTDAFDRIKQRKDF